MLFLPSDKNTITSDKIHQPFEYHAVRSTSIEVGQPSTCPRHKGIGAGEDV
jgi:hypothetical protein